MHDWFNAIAAESDLPADAATQLRADGYVVIEGAAPQAGCAQLAEAYDAAVLTAHPDDISNRSSTRISDFVNRGPSFDELYLYGPLLAACCQIIARPFKLSTMHARTIEPGTPAEPLHVDFERAADGWPMIGFIIMVDAFQNDNGATRFVPGSQMAADLPDEAPQDAGAFHKGQALACGPAGSMIIYNGSVWHGYTANCSKKPRRSIQGAFIRREATSGANLPARMRHETLARISDLAKYLLNLGLDF